MKLNEVVAIPALVLAAGISLAACGGGSAAPTPQTVHQWWSNTGQATFQRIDRDLGQITSDSQYDPASLPDDGDTLVSDAQNALTRQPPVDAKDYNDYLHDIISFGQLNQSGNGNGPLTAQTESASMGARDHVTAFYNVLACYGVSGTGTCQSSQASNSDSSAPDPNQSTYAPATDAAPTDTLSPTLTPTPTPTAYFINAVAVVQQYYEDINDQNYAAAWALGGDNIGGNSYAGWVAGFDTTVSVSLGTPSAFGSDQVRVSLSALQRDGSLKTYEGTYTVSGGVIVAANIVQTG